MELTSRLVIAAGTNRSHLLRNIDRWRPTKFVREGRRLRASRNPAHVSISSRFAADIVAPYYESAIRAHAQGRLLDMGCGYVPLYDAYSDLVSESICIDWENSPHDNPHLDQIVDLAGALPFESATFDTVLLTDVLEHIPVPMNLMCEITRILRPGGKLILGVPFLYWLHEVPHDYYRYTEFALRRFCQLSGLRVVDFVTYGGLPEVLLDLTSKGLNFFPRPLAVSLRPLHTLASLLCKTKLVCKLSERSKSSFPLGYVVSADKI
jgi:SAM-dependent methyltransferase